MTTAVLPLQRQKKTRPWTSFYADRQDITDPNDALNEYFIPATEGIATSEKDYSVSVSKSETGLSSAFKFLLVERTSSSNIDYSIPFFEYAYRNGDTNLFMSLLDAINLRYIPVEDFLKILRYSLNLGLYNKAQKLVELGRERYPQNSEVEKITYILAPSKIVKNNLPSDPDATADMAWLKENSSEYQGLWIALQAGVLLAKANNYHELINLLEKPIDKRILITPVY